MCSPKIVTKKKREREKKKREKERERNDETGLYFANSNEVMNMPAKNEFIMNPSSV